MSRISFITTVPSRRITRNTFMRFHAVFVNWICITASGSENRERLVLENQGNQDLVSKFSLFCPSNAFGINQTQVRILAPRIDRLNEKRGLLARLRDAALESPLSVLERCPSKKTKCQRGRYFSGPIWSFFWCFSIAPAFRVRNIQKNNARSSGVVFRLLLIACLPSRPCWLLDILVGPWDDAEMDRDVCSMCTD